MINTIEDLINKIDKDDFELLDFQKDYIIQQLEELRFNQSKQTCETCRYFINSECIGDIKIYDESKYEYVALDKSFGCNKWGKK